jgi:hypothetical protein
MKEFFAVGLEVCPLWTSGWQTVHSFSWHGEFALGLGCLRGRLHFSSRLRFRISALFHGHLRNQPILPIYLAAILAKSTAACFVW